MKQGPIASNTQMLRALQSVFPYMDSLIMFFVKYDRYDFPFNRCLLHGCS